MNARVKLALAVIFFPAGQRHASCRYLIENGESLTGEMVNCYLIWARDQITVVYP